MRQIAFFRFTETDARILLSAHGLHGFEVDHLQNESADEQKEKAKPGESKLKNQEGELTTDYTDFTDLKVKTVS
jgi:hypothetical protein